MLVLVLVSVLVGAGTALSPCALPVLPALLSAGAGNGARRPLGVVLGLSATFMLTIVGGAGLLRHVGLSDAGLRRLGIGVLLLAGVAALVPAAAAILERPLAGLSRLGPRRLGQGFGSGLVVGGALGFVYAPCAGPILAAVISVSAARGRTLAIAAAYVAGSATVLLGIALGGRKVIAAARRVAGPAVQRVLGLVMIATALALVAGLDTQFETALARHTSSALTLTGGLERSHAVARRLDTVRGAARFAPRRRTSDLPVYGPAPDFTGTQRWFNTPGNAPLTLSALRGRVVLVDFWTYTCINCLRTLPYLEAWDRRYRAAGLTIVGVHSPEFGFEHDAGNVARAIRDNGIHYPVVQDNDMATWNAWGNQYWPAEYLIDARGRVRHVQFGEGDYKGSEAAIRSLLVERDAGVLGAAHAHPHDTTPVSAQGTPETYIGADRAERFVGEVPTPGTRTYDAPAAAPPLSHFALGGRWTIGGQSATARRNATLTATVQARFVYLVLSPPRTGPGAVTVRLDDGHPRRLAVTQQRLYRLVALPREGRHRLDLALAPGTSAYAFTFG